MTAGGGSAPDRAAARDRDRADAGPAHDAVLRLSGVEVRRSGTTILGPLDWRVAAGERWVVLGPNGSGKTTLLQVASSVLWPSVGTVEVLGDRLGEVDARELRRRIGYAGAGPSAGIDPRLTAEDVVVSAKVGALAPWWHEFGERDRRRARELLGRLGIGSLGARSVGTLSTGERQRALIARALMPDPELLLLDEPAAGLDLGAREDLVAAVADLAAHDRPAAIVLVTHHVEEVPAGFGHALLLRAGRAVAVGVFDEALSSATLSATFGRPLVLAAGDDGRFHAGGTRGAG